MAYTRKVRIEYYQVVKAPKDDTGNKDQLFKLEILINKASNLGIGDRTYNYYQEEARLDQYKYNKLDDYWYLNFVRLRQTKIPSKAKRNSIAEPIKLAQDEYIGEDVTALYDCKNNILALQRNRDSLSSTGIENYLSQLYDSDVYDIYLRPIPINNINSKLERAQIYRKLTMRFACATNKKRKNINALSFGRLFQYFDRFNPQVATVTLSLGHVQKGSLDSETIKDTLKEIDEASGLVTGAELNVKYSEIEPVDTIDLFSMKSHDFITIKLEKLETIDFMDISDEIHKKYNKSKKALLESLK